MASSNGQRVAAFFLAALFLASTVATTAYVITQINQDDVLVSETPEERIEGDQAQAQREAEEAAIAADTCGSRQFDAVEPRTIPAETTGDPVTELQIVDVREGDGEEVLAGDCVAALYYGTLATDGSNFDGNYENGQPIEFSLDQVIQGWTDGIPGMKVGGVRRLTIPAAQAYGSQERGGIPADSDLIFEVEIVSTRRQP